MFISFIFKQKQASEVYILISQIGITIFSQSVFFNNVMKQLESKSVFA